MFEIFEEQSQDFKIALLVELKDFDVKIRIMKKFILLT